MRQRIAHGAAIDALTAEEAAEIFAQPRENVVLGLGGGVIEEIMDDMPMRGTRRQITSYRRGTGGDNFIVPAAKLILLTDYDAARIAGTLMNVGANPVLVYLAQTADVQVGNATVVVAASLNTSGSWDFKLSNDVWCGPVSVYSTLGTTLVWGVH